MLLRLILVAFFFAGPTGARAKTVAEAFDAEMRAWMAAHGIAHGGLALCETVA